MGATGQVRKPPGTGRTRCGRRPRRGTPSQEAWPVYPAAAAITAPEAEFIPAFQFFRRAVARAQLTAWLPRGRHTIVDVSGPNGPGAELAAAAGHAVLRVREDGAPAVTGRLDRPNGPAVPRPGNGSGASVIPPPRGDAD